MKHNTISGDKLWDEILKAIVDVMPEQLFPLFKEIYGKEYPKGTPIQLISTEHSTYQDNAHTVPSSKLMDLSLLVANTDYYHIECQMENDTEMVIRMVSYDLHFALQHSTEKDTSTGEILIRFPQSVVIYPNKNNALPDKLRCRILFPDNSEHIYQIPTVKIQSYSLQEIHKKHLTLFLPYLLLRLKPHSKSAKLTKEELTAFVQSIIFILEDEVSGGYLTKRECQDYVNLFLMASSRIFHRQPQYHEEVLKLTKPLIKLPSVQIQELEEALAQEKAEHAAIIADKDAEIAGKDAEIADKDAEIMRLKQLLSIV